jgi:hypothetical protein
MVETYGASESRIYYVEETNYGETPANPTVLDLKAESIDPGVNPSNIKVRGIGSVDLQTIKKGLRRANLKILYPLPSDAPINFLQSAKVELDKSLSIQVLYYKGLFAEASDIISLIYKGCKFHSLAVECHIEDVVKATAELWGQNVTVGTSKISGATYNEYAGAVPWYSSYVKKDTTTLERVTDWRFNIANNLKRVPVIKSSGADILKYLRHRHRDLTGEITFEFEDKEEFDDVIADTEFSLEFGLGASNKAVFSNCKWENVSTPTRIEDLVSLRAPFVAKTMTVS